MGDIFEGELMAKLKVMEMMLEKEWFFGGGIWDERKRKNVEKVGKAGDRAIVRRTDRCRSAAGVKRAD
jgi:hypothetical protein